MIFDPNATTSDIQTMISQLLWHLEKMILGLLLKYLTALAGQDVMKLISLHPVHVSSWAEANNQKLLACPCGYYTGEPQYEHSCV